MDTEELRTIWVCLGVPGSGKTTWSLEQLAKYPGRYKRVNRDSIRYMIDGERKDWDSETLITDLRNTVIDRSLRKNYDVIVDDTNFRGSNWTAICEIAKNVGNVRVIEKFFSIDLKEALERNEKRQKRVPEDVIRSFYKKYIIGKPITPRDVFFPRVIQEYPDSDPDKTDAIIVDVDGTVAHHLNRSPYDMSKVLDDYPDTPICSLVRVLSKTYTILFVSGREDCAREDTELWFQVHDIPYLKLFMRKTGDNRKDTCIKREIYEADIEPFYNVKYILDDRRTVVDFWRKMNLCCLQVASGDF
jgi:predicted kinase